MLSTVSEWRNRGMLADSPGMSATGASTLQETVSRSDRQKDMARTARLRTEPLSGAGVTCGLGAGVDADTANTDGVSDNMDVFRWESDFGRASFGIASGGGVFAGCNGGGAAGRQFCDLDDCDGAGRCPGGVWTKSAARGVSTGANWPRKPFVGKPLAAARSRAASPMSR